MSSDCVSLDRKMNAISIQKIYEQHSGLGAWIEEGKFWVKYATARLVTDDWKMARESEDLLCHRPLMYELKSTQEYAQAMLDIVKSSTPFLEKVRRGWSTEKEHTQRHLHNWAYQLEVLRDTILGYK